MTAEVTCAIREPDAVAVEVGLVPGREVTTGPVARALALELRARRQSSSDTAKQLRAAFRGGSVTVGECRCLC